METVELVISRIFDAPRELVWKAWTEPERLMKWWGPKVFTSPFCKIDLRVGGSYLFCMRSPDGKDFWNTGVYREVVTLERIVYTDMFADAEGNVVPASHYGLPSEWPPHLLVTVTFEDEQGKTRMTLRQSGIPVGPMPDMAREGWNGSLDKLAETLNPINPSFTDAIIGLERGDFSRLDPLFIESGSGDRCWILAWYEEGLFATEPQALNEALTCACFNGRTKVAEFLLDKGVDPAAGSGTGLNAFHWAANRGQLETVKLLIERNAPLEVKSMYGGTVLGTAVWSAINEPKPDHLAIIEALIEAGANLQAAEYPTGNDRVDELLQRHGRKVDESR